MTNNSLWDAQHYDQKLGFVSQLGQDLVAWLQPKPGERVLDLGCGTGDLTAQISQSGAHVVGMDISASMVGAAQAKYEQLQFIVGNAEDFHTDEPFDAVFSNAALHWMTHPSNVIACVWQALTPGGRFVAELGGKGNVGTVISACEEALDEIGVSSQGKNPWYFPSIGQYTTLLEHQGFHTADAIHFDRPTEMLDGDNGLEHWLLGFAGSYLDGLDLSTQRRVIERVATISRPHLFNNGRWWIDYKRLRIRAIKPRQ